MEDIRIDGHKLLFHPHRVARWLDGEDIYPIYCEVSPGGGCNHRCIFCAPDFMGYTPRTIGAELLLERLGEMARLGLKSVMFAGEGEPCLHPEIGRLVRGARAAGLDASMTTNGVLLERSGVEDFFPALAWIRISINAATAESYAAIHRAKPAEFAKVLAQLKLMASIKKRHGLATTIGSQCVLIPQNFDEVPRLARLLRDLGADYFSVKPYCPHPKTGNVISTSFGEAEIQRLRRDLEAAETPSFRILFRIRALDKIQKEDRPYASCLALPFWSYISAAGDVYACSTYLGEPEFAFGNILTSSFEEIWRSERRKRFMASRDDRIDFSRCRYGCRMDEINRYLWELTHPGLHANFI